MSKIIPADDALLAMSDTDLLQLMEDAGLDTAGIADREGALVALKAKRDAEAPLPDAVTADPGAAGQAMAELANPGAPIVHPSAPQAVLGDPAPLEEPQYIAFEIRMENGERVPYAVAPWPQVALISVQAMEGSPEGLFTISHDADHLTISAANGSADYQRTGTGQVFTLVHSEYEPAPPVTINTVADDEDQDERPDRPTISSVLASAVKQAQAEGDAVRHAALHNFEIAFGDFKRAAAQVERHVEVPTPLYGFVKAVQES